MAAYEPVQPWEIRRCHSPRPGVVAFRDTVLFWTHQQGTFDDGIYNRRKVRGGSSWSLHAVGRAWDCGIPNLDVGAKLAERFRSNANICGITEVIFNRMRWTPDGGLQSYHGVDPHTGHIHIGFSIKVADSAASHDALVKWFTIGLFS